MVQQPTIPPAQLVVMQLLEVVNQTEPDLDKIEKLLNQDLTLSLKLLRYINHPQALPTAHRLVSPGRKAPWGNAQPSAFVALIAATSAEVKRAPNSTRCPSSEPGSANCWPRPTRPQSRHSKPLSPASSPAGRAHG